MKVNIGKHKTTVVVNYDDVWSMDFTLSHIILPCLMQFKDDYMGIPGSLSIVGGEEYGHQLSFDFYQESHDFAFNIRLTEWDEILNKMIWSFQQIVYQNYSEQYQYGEWELAFKEYEGKASIDPISGKPGLPSSKPEKYVEMIPPDPQKYWMDHTGLTIHEERIQEGIDLFAKYYRALWI